MQGRFGVAVHPLHGHILAPSRYGAGWQASLPIRQLRLFGPTWVITRRLHGMYTVALGASPHFIHRIIHLPTKHIFLRVSRKILAGILDKQAPPMPPKKEKLSKEQVRDLLRNYGIRFEGPVPPRDWPSEHERHFHAIRDISYIRYDDYKHNRNVERERRRLYKQRANKLRQKASDLLEDLSINEATWRAALEQVVSEPFEQDVVWLVSHCTAIDCNYADRIASRRCGDETWFADFLASPLDQGTRATLRARQTLRKKCTCESGPPLARTRNK